MKNLYWGSVMSTMTMTALPRSNDIGAYALALLNACVMEVCHEATGDENRWYTGLEVHHPPTEAEDWFHFLRFGLKEHLNVLIESGEVVPQYLSFEERCDLQTRTLLAGTDPLIRWLVDTLKKTNHESRMSLLECMWNWSNERTGATSCAWSEIIHSVAIWEHVPELVATDPAVRHTVFWMFTSLGGADIWGVLFPDLSTKPATPLPQAA